LGVGERLITVLNSLVYKDKIISQQKVVHMFEAIRKISLGSRFVYIVTALLLRFLVYFCFW